MGEDRKGQRKKAKVQYGGPLHVCSGLDARHLEIRVCSIGGEWQFHQTRQKWATYAEHVYSVGIILGMKDMRGGYVSEESLNRGGNSK